MEGGGGLPGAVEGAGVGEVAHGMFPPLPGLHGVEGVAHQEQFGKPMRDTPLLAEGTAAVGGGRDGGDRRRSLGVDAGAAEGSGSGRGLVAMPVKSRSSNDVARGLEPGAARRGLRGLPSLREIDAGSERSGLGGEDSNMRKNSSFSGTSGLTPKSGTAGTVPHMLGTVSVRRLSSTCSQIYKEVEKRHTLKDLNSSGRSKSPASVRAARARSEKTLSKLSVGSLRGRKAMLSGELEVPVRGGTVSRGLARLWRTGGFFVHKVIKYVTAGRDIIAENPELDDSEVLRWKTRTEASVVYGLCSMLLNVVFSAVYFSVGFFRAATTAVCHVAAILFALVLLRFLNRSSLGTPHDALNMFVFMLISLSLTVPLAMHVFLGGGYEASDVVIWSLLAPCAALFLMHDRPLTMVASFLGIRTALATVVIGLQGQLPSEVSPADGVRYEAAVVALVIFSDCLCPISLAFAFRRSIDEFVWWMRGVTGMREQMSEKQDTNLRLINGLFPPGKSDILHNEKPESWYLHSPDHIEFCSMVQMDIKGFTELSSMIDPKMLVDMINAVFTSIDEAAEIIGNVWKVETIGDCYKAVLGGFSPCQDHAHKATALACSILEIINGISFRLGIPLKVRCGVHSGPVTGAIIGSMLPRYLVYGSTCEVVNLMEATADTGCVQCSVDTASLLGKKWVLGPARRQEKKTLSRGEIVSYMIEPIPANIEAMCSMQSGNELRGLLEMFQRKGLGRNIAALSIAVPASNMPVDTPVRQHTLPRGFKMWGSSSTKEVHVPVADPPLNRSSSNRRGSASFAGTSSARELVNHMVGAVTTHNTPQNAANSLLERASGSPESGATIPSDPTTRTSAEISPGEGSRSSVPPNGQEVTGDGVLTSFSERTDAPGLGYMMALHFSQSEKANGLTSTASAIGIANNTAAGEDALVFSQSVGLTSDIQSLRESLNKMTNEWQRSSETFRGSRSLFRGMNFASPQAQVPLDMPILARESSLSAGVGGAGQQHSGRDSGGLPTPSSNRVTPSSIGGPPPISARTPSSGRYSFMSNLAAGTPKAGGTATSAADSPPPLIANRFSGLTSSTSPTASSRRITLSVLHAPANAEAAPPSRPQEEIARTSSSTLAREQAARNARRQSIAAWLDSPTDAEQQILAQVAGSVDHLMDEDWTVKVSTRIMDSFLLTLMLSALGYMCVLLAVSQETGNDMYKFYAIPPAAYAIVGFILLVVRAPRRASVRRGKTLVFLDILYFFSPAAFMGDYDARVLRGSLLWAFFAVLLQAGRGSDVRFLIAMFMYVVLVSVTNIWVSYYIEESSGEKLPWWDILLLVINHILPTTMFLMPLSSTAQHLWREFSHSQEMLSRLRKHVTLQRTLLNALVPQPVSQRLQEGEALIADRYEMATVLFLYFADFDQMIVDHGPTSTIQWLCEIYRLLDNCVSSWGEVRDGEESGRGVTKVETFANFYLAVSGTAQAGVRSKRHADDAVFAAVRMVQAVHGVLRPDGKPTELKVGLNSGTLCAGVIGLGSPRFSIFGDVVNVASRMASTADRCAEGNTFLHMNTQTAEDLTDDMKLKLQLLGLRLNQRENEIEIKGKGLMRPYMVEGRTMLAQRRSSLGASPDAAQGPQSLVRG